MLRKILLHRWFVRLQSVKLVPIAMVRAGYSMVVDHDGFEHAGYLSFMSMLALFPFLVLLVALAGVIGRGDIGAEFINLTIYTLPPEVADALIPYIDEIISGPPQGLLTLSILAALWTSSSALEGMRTTLNRAYNVATPPAYWLRRLMSIMQVLVFTAVIILIMLMRVFLPFVYELLEGMEYVPEALYRFKNSDSFITLASTGVLFVVIANLYYILPNIRQNFRAVAPGAMLTAIGWMLGASLFSYYLSHIGQVNVIYGGLGGVIICLLFFYIINIIFIYGAELNYQLITAFHEPIEKKE